MSERTVLQITCRPASGVQQPGQLYRLQAGGDGAVLDSWLVPDNATQRVFNAVMLGISQAVYDFFTPGSLMKTASDPVILTPTRFEGEEHSIEAVLWDIDARAKSIMRRCCQRRSKKGANHPQPFTKAQLGRDLNVLVGMSLAYNIMTGGPLPQAVLHHYDYARRAVGEIK